MESASLNLIGTHLIAFKASNDNEKSAFTIAHEDYKDNDTLISEKQMRDMIEESQEFYSNLIRSVANIRK